MDKKTSISIDEFFRWLEIIKKDFKKENEKRFVYKEIEVWKGEYREVQLMIADTWKKIIYGFNDITDLLNHQTNIIEELIIALRTYDDENADLLGKRIKDLEDFEECVDKAKELKAENQQLRKENEELKEKIRVITCQK